MMHTVQPLSELVDTARGPTRFALVCIGVFSVVAVVLALVGLYGVSRRWSVSARRRSVSGWRSGRRGSIFGLVVGQGMRLAALGIVIGLVTALALTRVCSRCSSA